MQYESKTIIRSYRTGMHSWINEIQLSSDIWLEHIKIKYANIANK